MAWNADYEDTAEFLKLNEWDFMDKITEAIGDPDAEMPSTPAELIALAKQYNINAKFLGGDVYRQSDEVYLVFDD